MEEDPREYMYHSFRPLIGYGAGGYAMSLYELLRTRGIGLSALTDKDPKKWGRTLYGMEIIPPGELPARYSDANILLLVASHNAESARADLAALGFTGERVIGEGETWMYHIQRWNHDFSFNRRGDLLAFGELLNDEASRGLFRLRYRHWLLDDRPDNPGSSNSIPEGFALHADSSGLSDNIDRWGGEAIQGDMVFEFDNGDGMLAPRIIMTLGYYRPDALFRLGYGAVKGRTRLFVRARGAKA